MLTRVERLERPPDARLDRVASHEVLGEVGGGVRQKHLVEIVPVPTVERPRVANRQGHDLFAVLAKPRRIIDAVKRLVAERNG